MTTNPEDVPSLALVSAWETLGTLRTELVPIWAAHWLAQGLDGEGIVALASLGPSDIREVHDLLPDALVDAGVEPISRAGAAARLAFDHVARMHLDGKAGWRWVLTAVTGVFVQNDYGREFHNEPLGALYGLEDEVAGGWGRRLEEIEAEVHDACERQIQLTS
ncbi:hypothetical protein ACFV9G_16655 [Nocardioides sp. NPDC059952]|uniref:hypothetical protein n=1 Tax=Nocardioides sp. NPDC059952 TaxID=3347014 RepID=UPI003659FE84